MDGKTPPKKTTINQSQSEVIGPANTCSHSSYSFLKTDGIRYVTEPTSEESDPTSEYNANTSMKTPLTPVKNQPKE